MFEETLLIVRNARSFDDLKTKMKGRYIDVKIKPGDIEALAARLDIHISPHAQAILATMHHPIALTALLAIEGNNDDKVAWLRRLGAHTADAILGYIIAGNHDKVDEYLKHGASIRDVAQGYAMAGNHDKVNSYRVSYPETIKDTALGYASVNNENKVTECYDLQHEYLLLEDVAQGYAMAGNHEGVTQCLGAIQAYVEDVQNNDPDQHQLEERHPNHLQVIANVTFGYALAGNHDAVQRSLRDYPDTIYNAVQGFAMAGDHDGVTSCLENSTDLDAVIEHAVYAYATVGDHGKVDEFRRLGANVGSIVNGYRMSGVSVGNTHIQRKKYDIDYLLDNYLDNRRAVTDSSKITREYFHSRFFPRQKSFTQKEAAVNALKLALAGQSVNLSKHLETLRDGTLGKDLRKFIKSGMADSLAGRVRTVSEFVQALERKNALAAPRPGS